MPESDAHRPALPGLCDAADDATCGAVGIC